MAREQNTDPHWDETKPTFEEIRRVLGGKSLACFCSEGNACHADILLGIANPGAYEQD